MKSWPDDGLMNETCRQWVKNNKILLCLPETYNFIIFFKRQYYFFIYMSLFSDSAATITIFDNFMAD